MAGSIRPQFGIRLANLVMNLRLVEFVLVSRSAEVRDRFGLGQTGNQHPEKPLRFLLLSESRRTLPHSHNRLVVGSSPTGPTTSLRSCWTSADCSSPRAKRSVVHRLEAMLLETPVHPTRPTILTNSSISGIKVGCTCPIHPSTANEGASPYPCTTQIKMAEVTPLYQ
jgi:hypothetical protein